MKLKTAIQNDDPLVRFYRDKETDALTLWNVLAARLNAGDDIAPAAEEAQNRLLHWQRLREAAEAQS